LIGAAEPLIRRVPVVLVRGCPCQAAKRIPQFFTAPDRHVFYGSFDEKLWLALEHRLHLFGLAKLEPTMERCADRGVIMA
jgi:hypothetical protein